MKGKAALTKSNKILVVEDNIVNIAVVCAYLDILGYQYDVSKTGYDAIAKASQTLYSLILMDIQMPDISGIDVTYAIRKLEKAERRSRTPIVALTAHTIKSIRDKCIAADMDGFLEKPYNKDVLQAKIQACASYSI